MADSEMTSPNLACFEKRLGELGLLVLGVFLPDGKERLPPNVIIKKPMGVMIASVGQAMWQMFSNSPEFKDGQPNPMDRWTKRKLDVVATEFRSTLALPFDQPYYPFQAWAKRAAGIETSPLNLLIHPQFGLWFGLRGVMFFDDHEMRDGFAEKPAAFPIKPIHPCNDCLDKPCLSGCPVDAFSINQLNVERCFFHLDSNENPQCMNTGCNARNACPIGSQYRYGGEQLAFHMTAFRGS